MRDRRWALCRSWSVLPVAGLLILGGAGCGEGGSDTSAAPPSSNALNLDDIPPEQRAAFEDGVVSTLEYTEAFQQFEACANADERNVVDVASDPATGLIRFGVKGELTVSGPDNGSAVDRCYRRFFSEIELEWQTTDAAVLAAGNQESLDTFRRDLEPCLEANGYDVPDDIESGTQLFGDLTQVAITLINEGTCVLD